MRETINPSFVAFMLLKTGKLYKLIVDFTISLYSDQKKTKKTHNRNLSAYASYIAMEDSKSLEAFKGRSYLPN